MERDESRGFPEWIKLIVDRVCETESLSRQELANDLGVHLHSVSTAAYRGEIGFGLVERIAQRAKTTPEELTEIELAWIRMRAQRPRDEALRRSMDIIGALTEHLLLVEEWLAERGLLEACRRFTKRDPLVRRTRQRIQKKR